MNSEAKLLLDARDFLILNRDEYDDACRDFVWPKPGYFNFALDWIDWIGAERDREALRIVRTDGPRESRTFRQISENSARLANYMRKLGIQPGNPVLVMLGNIAPLWETIVAAMKLQAVVIPAPPLLSASDLADRIERGGVRLVIAETEYAERFAGMTGFERMSVGEPVPGWLSWEDHAAFPTTFEPASPTPADSPLLLYFTSGTTAAPKLVCHSHGSYPIGHLSTMYWLGLMPGDVHLNISSPGWAKHAWSCIFAPWLAEATVLVLDDPRFHAVHTLDAIVREGVTSFCAPPTVWRMLVQQDLSAWNTSLREVASAGEPLNPEIIERVRQDWSLTVRDGFGQTETCALIGNSPGQPVVPGKVGRPLPGFSIRLRDAQGNETTEGEICVELRSKRPVGFMQGYAEGRDVMAVDAAFYRTGDVACVDDSGYFTYVGRADDVFKASDYRISPFELESVLVEHPAVVEAAVVPSPDPTRLAVPKAFVALAQGHTRDARTAASIMAHARERLGPFKRVRRIEFADLPKTVSGKIRRVELRKLEQDRRQAQQRGAFEWWEDEV